MRLLTPERGLKNPPEDALLTVVTGGLRLRLPAARARALRGNGFEFWKFAAISRVKCEAPLGCNKRRGASASHRRVSPEGALSRRQRGLREVADFQNVEQIPQGDRAIRESQAASAPISHFLTSVDAAKARGSERAVADLHDGSKKK
jgi:hypothetical protein